MRFTSLLLSCLVWSTLLVPQESPAQASAPQMDRFSVDWDWGERYFSQEFTVSLRLVNDCDTTQIVILDTSTIPYLTMRKVHSVSRQSTEVVLGKVKLPDPPKPPPVQPFSGQWFGWVEPPEIGPQPLGTPPPIFHQPNFSPIEGVVIATHAAAPDGANAVCNPMRTRYEVAGHMHWGPPDPEEEDTGPSSLASTDPCVVWWNTSEEPAQRRGDCTAAMQLLAERFLIKVVPDYWRNAPKEWSWLEEFGGVSDKDINELLAMKARANLIMGTGS
ncbi:hypothetical protein R0137_05280 [Congregibacter brevis]|uniref:Uncharacterized protein n=1 Tax=Congregibacter brevis TaxID=3081201 RepID=A0ABZ0IH12_9GAMM|nr:hypothetical protein R0137_05280 [Congregibacter sp. IMCC45268]